MTKETMLRKLTEEVAREAGREAAKEGVKESVRETLKLLGIDVSNPGALQKDFHYLREVRTGSDETKRLLKSSAVKTFIVAIVTIILMGIKHWVKDFQV